MNMLTVHNVSDVYDCRKLFCRCNASVPRLQVSTRNEVVMAKVQFDGVRKVYDNGQVAVAGASFEIADGE